MGLCEEFPLFKEMVWAKLKPGYFHHDESSTPLEGLIMLTEAVLSLTVFCVHSPAPCSQHNLNGTSKAQNSPAVHFSSSGSKVSTLERKYRDVILRNQTLKGVFDLLSWLK